MLHVKKLRLLQKKGDDIPPDKAIEKTRKYLTVVGNAIGSLCSRAANGHLPSTKLGSSDLHTKLWQVRGNFPQVRTIKRCAHPSLLRPPIRQLASSTSSHSLAKLLIGRQRQRRDVRTIQSLVAM
jgi:hypothetical protein